MTIRRLVHVYTLLGALAAGWAALTVGCFDPSTPPCAFTCTSATKACPANYSCEADGRCHHLEGGKPAMCGDELGDAGTDAAGNP